MVGSLEKNFGSKNRVVRGRRCLMWQSDVDGFESVVTREYFEDGWDDLEIEGNPEMKEYIKRNIRFIAEKSLKNG